jgi:hypothetical protein
MALQLLDSKLYLSDHIIASECIFLYGSVQIFPAVINMDDCSNFYRWDIWFTLN